MWIGTLWWLLFSSAIGLCIGSFLNVVIYRLPRSQSLRDPVWSACPCCGHRIRWYDNLPVISFLRLRGRCRDCGLPIATRYVVVELLMGIIVLVLLDAFFIGRVRSGFEHHAYTTLTDLLAMNWPILLAHVILFACLLSMSAIDLEHYWVDVRFTTCATISGFVLHTLWTTPHIKPEWPRPGDATSIVCLAALLGLGIGYVIYRLLPDKREEEPRDELPDTIVNPVTGEQGVSNTPPSSRNPTAQPDSGSAGVVGDAVAMPTADCEQVVAPLPAVEEHGLEARATLVYVPPPPPPSRFGGWAMGVLFVGLLVALLVDGLVVKLPHAPRAIVPIVALFLLIVAESWKERESDTQIITSIEQERHAARGMVLRELLVLCPAIVLGAAAWWWIARSPPLTARAGDALHFKVAMPAVDMLRHWQPLYGLATAAAGFIIGGALGWAVRILFTLAFGKEAFGTGDIHLLAAAGCIAGWQVAVLGFVLSCLLALAGIIATLPRKTARAVPLGPWLSISFLIVVVFYEPIVKSRPITGVIGVWRLLSTGNSQLF